MICQLIKLFQLAKTWAVLPIYVYIIQHIYGLRVNKCSPGFFFQLSGVHGLKSVHI